MDFGKNLKKIYASEFFKYSAALLSSNALSQIISFCIYFVIVRLYEPEVFGHYTWFMSVTGILSILFTGRYELAIAIPKSQKKAIALFQLATLLNIALFILFLLIILIWQTPLAHLLKKEAIRDVLFLLPICAFLNGMWQTVNHYFIREKKYYNISTYHLSQSIIAGGLKCLLGIKGFILVGLIGGQFFSLFVSLLISLFLGRKSLKAITKIDRQEIRKVSAQYANFPKYEMPHGLLNTLASYLPVLLLSFYFPMEDIGIFSLALTMGFTPVSLFSHSVYQVFLQKISHRLHNKEQIKNECWLFCKMCLWILLPIFVLFIFVPESFFTTLFSLEWRGVGLYLKIMLPWFFLIVLVASLSFIPDLFFKQKTAMNIEIGYVILRASALLTGVYFKNFTLAIVLFSAVSTFMMFIKLYWYFQLINRYESNI